MLPFKPTITNNARCSTDFVPDITANDVASYAKRGDSIYPPLLQHVAKPHLCFVGFLFLQLAALLPVHAGFDLLQLALTC